jgi:16S rRNA (uracil1498-N3)-methyltransferase
VSTTALFLLPADRLLGVVPGVDLLLDGEEGRHAAAVRRIRPGEALDVSDGAGRVARCLVAAVERDRLVLRVQAVDVVPEPAVRLVLVQALAKGGRDEQAVETATELGVDEVLAWQSERCVVRWSADRGDRGLRRWEVTCREAAKQSRRARVPVVGGPLTGPALAERVAGSALALVLHESAERSVSDVVLPPAGEILVVVGPEGGISDAELAVLSGAGGTVVRLGREVLRTSTAGPAVLAWLAARTGRWT